MCKLEKAVPSRGRVQQTETHLDTSPYSHPCWNNCLGHTEIVQLALQDTIAGLRLDLFELYEFTKKNLITQVKFWAQTSEKSTFV